MEGGREGFWLVDVERGQLGRLGHLHETGPTHSHPGFVCLVPPCLPPLSSFSRTTTGPRTSASLPTSSASTAISPSNSVGTSRSSSPTARSLGLVSQRLLPCHTSLPHRTTGKAYHIKELAKGFYYYPQLDGGGQVAETSRPLKDGELAEWILLDSTPATCANIALHNLWPGQIDLVISGPNLGRNTSAAFALSSGTIGAALSSSLSKIRSIAISYGTVVHPTPTSYHEPAHRLGGQIIQHLWHNWGEDRHGLRDNEIDLYSINIPLIEDILSPEGLKVCWTTIWRNSYSRLFKNVSVEDQERSDTNQAMALATTPAHSSMETGGLLFKWAPEMKDLITPPLSSLPAGSDGWAIHQGYVSVTPLRATFGEPPINQGTDVEDRIWKMRL